MLDTFDKTSFIPKKSLAPISKRKPSIGLYFIISVIGEEFGLLGITIILIAFFFMLYWITTYAGIISNRFSSLTLIGFASIIFIHLIVNFGMTVGLLPVTGLPAPFLSYGGSFLLSCMFILALSNNIINHHI